MTYKAVVQNGVVRLPPGVVIAEGTEVQVVVSSGETQEAGTKYWGPHYYGEQDENGVDLSLIRENLKLTPLERIRKADAARRQALKLLEYGRQHRENAARTDR
ncbi:MAG: hypothetical protein HY718_00845 [Planctomycetes bacterium]|nr:hypothetical protein [Planctomycetota bacterium]